ncbi:MAG TPA: TIGR00266 family protein [Polyangiaceae bacterium]|nr:TIGR00266 family protein [Polyangiaceae bacterium]
MQFEVQYRPAHTLAVVHLAPNETVRAEASAMISMTRNIAVYTSARSQGGFLKGLRRAMLGGESFFTNTFTATGGPGHVTLAPALTGDMIVHPVSPGADLFIQGSSYVAAPDSVMLDTKWQGMKGFFSGESLFFLHATGAGPVLLNAFGAVETIDLDGELIVDTGHLVAFTSGIRYEVTTASPGLIASFLSGEGFVLRVSGRGRLYLQSRNPTEYGSAVGRNLPPRQA